MKKTEIKIDYLSVTFPFISDKNDADIDVVEQIIKMIITYFNISNYEIFSETYTTNRFKYQYKLGEHITLRLHGAENDSGHPTCQLELKGEGCRDYERRNPEKDWMDLFIFLAMLNAKFKRLDIAIDDFDGSEVDLEFIMDKIKKNIYTSSFNSKPKPIGTFEDGLSIQFGSKQSELELVIYDKLKEQQSRKKLVDEEVYWVRYEMRFRGEKAQFLIETMFKQYQTTEKQIDFQTLAFEQLYRILDLKKENNYKKKYQTKVDTDVRWNNFLNNVKKGTLASKTEAISSLETHVKFIEDKACFYLLFIYLKSNRNHELFFTEIFKMMNKHSLLSKQRFQRLNLYLSESFITPLSDENLEEVQQHLLEISQERDLPF